MNEFQKIVYHHDERIGNYQQRVQGFVRRRARRPSTISYTAGLRRQLRHRLKTAYRIRPPTTETKSSVLLPACSNCVKSVTENRVRQLI